MTCGEAKGDWFDEDHFVIPSDPNCENRFRYDPNGTIRAVEVNDISAINMINHLNLSAAALAYERGVVVKGVEEDIIAGRITANSKQAEISRWRAREDG